ncbi:hypothetical protein AMEX_G20686 [Astyanax mexicanus]|uniref:Ig-like domain-containing protein n=1 Tax=Astyanax mexicanus TaxID=7994 RepID=A0A8T2L5V2_ASTMX|nr:hypothetical protein AMEX_G20686 [Astyanax mexicanus]
MSVRLLVCLIAFWGEFTASIGNVNEIAQGNDVSYSCLSGEAPWTGPRHDNTVRVKINRTEYLLIKNFQKQNEANYICGNEKVNLQLKSASSKDKSVLFRASEGDSLFLFCKTILNSSFNATWFWRPHNSNTTDKIINLGLDSTHFGNRLQIKNKNNDFSASITPVDWSDSGIYKCEISSSPARTVFEVVVVRVHADPQHPNNGDDVTLKCEISNQIQKIKLYWINRKTQENFPNPHQLRNVTAGQMNWACAVFNSSTLKALIPLTLTISQPPGESKTTASPDVSQTAPDSQGSVIHLLL